jgi:hypothetical protein
MNVYGELTLAQLENLTADPTLSAQRKGRLWWRSDLSTAKVDLGGSADTLAMLAATQTFSNKSVSDSWTMAQVATPATPAASFNKIYPKADGTFYQLDPAGLESQVGAIIKASSLYSQVSTPATPSAGTTRLYAKSDGFFYALNSSGVETQIGTVSSTNYNLLLNSNFSFWQRGTSKTVANTVSSYLPDRWYAKNSLGTNGVITISQVAGVSDGAAFGCKLLISTAPTAGQTNGCELYQTLDNATSLLLYNKVASFQIKVKAFGNVNQVGVQFFYKTSEGKVDTSIGAEQTATVSTGAFATASITNQAIGTSQTASGVIGVRIRITGVSSGNTYDLNNGFSVEQAIIVVAPGIISWAPAYAASAAELACCQRFYWRFNGAGSPFNFLGVGYFDSTTAVKALINFPVTMRTNPTCAISAGTDLAIERATSSTASGSGSPSFASATPTSVRISATSGTASTAGFPTIIGLQSSGWIEADAEI